ncbi:MAG: nitrate reductase cytochrome c-type subunit [Polyangiaceae bacterium]|jgi:cytochrome c-type protein NapB|nr:nitrate reductase cytochrome c-type subunit [Polyangiaceae bacterium]
MNDRDDDLRPPGPRLEPPPASGPIFVNPPVPSVSPLRPGRGWHVAGLFALAFAAVGFFTGVAQERRDDRAASPEDAPPTQPAPGYADLRARRRGPNAALDAGAIERFTAPPPPSAEGPPRTAERRERALADRRRGRAFDGAPPTIPHAVVAQAAFECLACHESGGTIAGKRAPAMSHERHDSCTQCHVGVGGPPAPVPSPLSPNAFVGLEPRGPGARAWPGAPPTIPHGVTMRTNCASCHGATGAPGLQTTHPERQSCTQCHAPDASLDQRPPEPPPAGPAKAPHE